MHLAALMILCLAGGPPPGRSTDEKALLALHEQVLRAHRESNVDLLLGPETADIVVVGRGEITRPTKAQRRARFGDYLGRTRFSVYEDLVPPIVKVSGDGTLGWVIVQVHAKGMQKQDDGKEEPLEFTAAWIELYEKQGGKWLAAGNVSNFKP
jgi:hypothetical protein